MSEISSLISAMSAQSTRHVSEQSALQRDQMTRSAHLEERIAGMTQSRAKQNRLHDLVTHVLSDAVATLKKNGDQIRQTSGGQ